MENQKKIGIWMDHSTANFINLDKEKYNFSIQSNFTFNDKEAALRRSESLMHNKENQMHETYYKEIGHEILKYQHILIFGPTQAKTELLNFLNKDLHYKNIQIDVKSADKMTENEKRSFVWLHFEKDKKQQF
jgi:stalled ribosome rescue protein Dom34